MDGKNGLYLQDFIFSQIMFDEQASHDIAKTSLELLCDVEIFLGLTCIIPMLELVQGLSKFAHNWDIFMCNFVTIVKEYEVQLY